MSRLLLVFVLVAGGCGASSSNAIRQAAGALILAGAATVAQGIAAGIAQSAVNERRASRPAEVIVPEKEPCNYYMRCEAVLNGRECFFETNDNRVVPCKSYDCSEGAPPELVAWCPPRGG
jgi:hypothetical protein